MKFNSIGTRVAHAALAIDLPAGDDLVENLLSCHSDGDRVARMRFMELLVDRVFPDPREVAEFADHLQSRHTTRSLREIERNAKFGDLAAGYEE